MITSKGTKGAKDTKGTKGAKGRVVAALLVTTLGVAPVAAQIAAAPLAAPPPNELAAALGALLSESAVRATAGEATLEFWWVRALPVAKGGEAGWARVPEGALVGAVRVTGPFKDIRGKTIAPGVYTLRLGLQPQNGDHLGASPFREHLLLSPAAEDTQAQPLGHEPAVELSKLAIGASHPAVLSIDPPAADAAALSTHINELDHQGLIVEVGTAAGSTLRFGLTLIGLIEP